MLKRPLDPHQQYLPPLIKDGSNKHEIWTKKDFNKYCLRELGVELETLNIRCCTVVKLKQYIAT